MNWNEFRTSYVKKHGTTPIATVSKAYHAQKTHTTARKSPARVSARKSPARKSHKSPVRKSLYKSPRKTVRRARSASPRKTIAKRSVRRVTKHKSLNLRKIYANTPKTRHYKRTHLKSIMKNEHEGRGSPTRGWASAAPQHGSERHQLKEKCGAKVFLDPAREAYPVVAAAKRGGSGCKISCHGVTAARNRACQQGRVDLAAKALKLGEKHCGWEKGKSPCRTKGAAPSPPKAHSKSK